MTNKPFASTFILCFAVVSVVSRTAGQTSVESASSITNVTGPRIQFAAIRHDFHRINSGEIVRHDFVFTNTGDALLEVPNVASSCGCTTAGEWTKQVEPGKTGVVPIEFNSGNYSGGFTKTVTVLCNDKSQPVLVLQLTGAIVKLIDVNPTMAVMNVTTETALNARTVVHIINNEDQPLVLSNPQSNNQIFSTELKTNEPGKSFDLLIGIKQPLEAGSKQELITLKTSSTNIPALNITVMAIVQPAIMTMPLQIILPTAPLQQNQTYSVAIHNNGTNALVLSEPSVNAKGVDVKLVANIPGRIFIATLNFPAGFEAPQGEATELRLKSNHPRFPVIKVPIIQAVRPPAIPPPLPPAVK